MTGITSAWFHTQGTERESQIVYDHQDTFKRNVLFVHPVPDGVSAQVHVGGRFQKHQLLPFQREGSHSAVAFVLKNKIGRLSQGVQYSKTYIVTGSGIFASDIAQTDN